MQAVEEAVFCIYECMVVVAEFAAFGSERFREILKDARAVVHVVRRNFVPPLRAIHNAAIDHGIVFERVHHAGANGGTGFLIGKNMAVPARPHAGGGLEDPDGPAPVFCGGEGFFQAGTFFGVRFGCGGWFHVKTFVDDRVRIEGGGWRRTFGCRTHSREQVWGIKEQRANDQAIHAAGFPGIEEALVVIHYVFEVSHDVHPEFHAQIPFMVK